MSQHKLLFLIIALASLLASCGKDDEPAPEPTPGPAEEVRRTVLVYQIANRNGLAANSTADLNEMRQGAADGLIPADGRLLVYNHRNDRAPVLVEISEAGIDTLAVYSTDLTSVSAQRMLDVFDNMCAYAPAREYGLILWGHGSGWIQDGVDEAPKRSYGGDNGKWMNMSSLAAILTAGPAFEYLYFDCCYMAGIEVAYELAGAVPYIAFSSMEIAAEGMPYHLTLGSFFDDDACRAVVGASRITVDYYRQWEATGSRPECNPSSFSRRYCSMSVVRTDALAALAEATAQIYALTPEAYPADMKPQPYGRGTYARLYYDFGKYLTDLCVDAGGNPRFADAKRRLAAARLALDDAVVFSDCMDRVFGTTTSIPASTGLTTYIMTAPSDAASRNYNTLGWYSDVASKLRF
ncbi:MAG: clostripain-related cysteine peptidase [Muribaculaceae bacterium]|nr:clostripain-related cysteine peptidase [Muribaculaceae bacterium]